MFGADFRAIVTDPFVARRRQEQSETLSEFSTRNDRDAAKPPRRTRGQRLAIAGFLGAFGLTILTVILTALWARSPDAHEPRPAAPSNGAPASPSVVPESRVERRAREDAAREEAAPEGADAAQEAAGTKDAGDPPANAAR